MNNKKQLDFQTIAVDFDGTLCYSKWPELGQPNHALIEYLQEWKRNGPAAPVKLCRKLSNGAGNRILNLMPSMTTFLKSSNSTNTTAARYTDYVVCTRDDYWTV